MIPLRDELPHARRPWVNYAIIFVTIAVWFLIQGAGVSPVQLAASVCDLGIVPAELTHQRPVGFAVPLGYGMACVVDSNAINWLTPLISVFLHGGWGHLLGNMLFLWVFGDNVEESMGHGRYLVFYLICGICASLAHVFALPSSAIPTVGASGAISGVMGAYLILFPNVRVRTLFFVFIVRIRAWILLLYWFGLQLFEGLSGPLRSEVSSGTAVWAHVGGFVAGVILIKFFERRRLVAPPFVTR